MTHKTWWRNWEKEGRMEFEMDKLLKNLHITLGDWPEIEMKFGLDSANLDCAIEQIWAMREGFA